MFHWARVSANESTYLTTRLARKSASAKAAAAAPTPTTTTRRQIDIGSLAAAAVVAEWLLSAVPLAIV